MLMVVLFHSYYVYIGTWPFNAPEIGSYNLLCECLHRIDMNIFVFISGFLYYTLRYHEGKYKNSRNFVLQKFRRLIVPYLFWGILQLLLFHLGWESIFNGSLHLWFLLMMFWMFLCIRLMERFNMIKSSNLYFDILLFFGFTCIFFLQKIMHLHPNFLSLSRLANYFPGFFLGYLFAKHDLANRFKNSNRLALVGGVFLSVSILIVSTAIQDHSNLVSRFISYVIIIFLLLLFKSINLKRYSIIESLDKYSMGIYIIHHIVIWLTLSQEPILCYANGHVLLFPIMIFFVSITVSWLCSWLISKSLFRFTIG